jgi:hypothetical protein
MKMVRFSGIKFAAGLAYETHNLLPSHEIRRTRIRRQIFATDAKKKIAHSIGLSGKPIVLFVE